MASLCLLRAYVGILAQFCNNCIPKRGVFLSKRIFAYIRIGICVDTVRTLYLLVKQCLTVLFLCRSIMKLNVFAEGRLPSSQRSWKV